MKSIVSFGSLLALCLLISACKDEIEEMKLSPEEKARVLALQNPFGKNLVRLTNSTSGTDVLIGLLGCRVYRAEPEQGVVAEWRRVKEVDDLNFLAAGGCQRQEIKFDGKHVYVSYCATAIGAGGGCGGGGGYYRSENGSDWEQEAKRGWAPVKRLAPPQD